MLKIMLPSIIAKEKYCFLELVIITLKTINVDARNGETGNTTEQKKLIKK